MDAGLVVAEGKADELRRRLGEAGRPARPNSAEPGWPVSTAGEAADSVMALGGSLRGWGTGFRHRRSLVTAAMLHAPIAAK